MNIEWAMNRINYLEWVKGCLNTEEQYFHPQYKNNNMLILDFQRLSLSAQPTRKASNWPPGADHEH